MCSQNKLLTLWHGWRLLSRNGWRTCCRTCPPGAGRKNCWSWPRPVQTGGLPSPAPTVVRVNGETHSYGMTWTVATVSCARVRPAVWIVHGLRLVATLVNACAPRPRQPERRRGMRRRPKRPNATQKSKRTSKRMCSSGPRGWPRPQMPLGWKMRHPSSSQSMDGA